MTINLSPLIERVHFPPISEVREWVAQRPAGGLPLVDLCQAVPDYPPAPELVASLKPLLDDPLTSKYSPDEGLPEVRESLSAYYQRKYQASVSPESFCLTIGASQAFWLAIITLCQAGDEVVVQAPYYFDHAMALEMLGIRAICASFPAERGGIPDPETLDGLVTAQTRAILVVTPSNPAGVITPPAVMEELFERVKRRGIALILDETYNEFIPGGATPHHLFNRIGWGDHLIQLASFGKTLALTGYRAGALVASTAVIRQALKVQDTMAVCQPRITQHAIRYGVDHLGPWIRQNCDMMECRHNRFVTEFSQPGNRFQLASSGAFFAWVRHPFEGLTGRQAARTMLDEAGVLCLPGEVFGPGLEGYLRLAFGNIREEEIPEAVGRFRGM